MKRHPAKQPMKIGATWRIDLKNLRLSNLREAQKRSTEDMTEETTERIFLPS
jgi:hypothetical protein